MTRNDATEILGNKIRELEATIRELSGVLNAVRADLDDALVERDKARQIAQTLQHEYNIAEMRRVEAINARDHALAELRKLAELNAAIDPTARELIKKSEESDDDEEESPL